MLASLISRELLNNLMTFRFASAIFIILLLVVANTIVLINDYEGRLDSHNDSVNMHKRQLQEKKTYSAGNVHIDRPPNPLSIFNVGFDKQLGNEVRIAHVFVPSLWDAKNHGSSNPLMDMFASMDIAFIFEVILSLLALIFAYDAFAGEYETGTLRLVLTHPVRRGIILVAKYISAMICLIVPLILSLLLSLILLTVSNHINLNSQDFLRVGGIILTSIIYLSIFYLIGLLISAVTRRTSTALMLSIFVWGFLVLVYPNMILAMIGPNQPSQERQTSAYNSIEQMWLEFDNERKQYLATDDFPGEDWGYELRGWGSRSAYLTGSPHNLFYKYRCVMNFSGFGEEDEPKIPHARKHFRYLVPKIIDTADKTWIIRKPALEDIYIHPAKMERIWFKLSPVGLYDAATEAWAGTDVNGVRDFFNTARQYRKQVIDYFYDKDVFGSRQWFSSDKEAADWSDLPHFNYQRVDSYINAMRALPDVCLLFMINIFLFVVIFMVFVKSEV